MKFKWHFFIIGLLSILASASSTLAQTPITATPITGTIYGENFGLIHLDYTTAARPAGYDGNQIDFYFPPWDPDYLEPGLLDWTAGIYDLSNKEKCNGSSCLLTGFLWNDRIGWIILDGKQIQNSFEDPNKFPETLFARVNFSGNFTGYVWSEHAGWIRLASNDAAGTNTPPDAQTADDPNDPNDQEDWGVFLDPSSAITAIDRPDPEDDISLGRPLQGYAWSQALGWIKFAPKDGESFTGLEGAGASGGAYTHWLPDTSPPEFYGESNVWFKNNHKDGVITWSALAADPESGIREDSKLTVTRDPRDEFAGCNTPIPEMVSHNLEGGTLSLTIPSIGLLQSATFGYCRYLLTGIINNNAGLSFEIGEGAGADSPPLVFSIRAGDIDEAKSTLDGSDAAIAAIADGIDKVEYNLRLLDLAGNPIVSITEGPERAIAVTASFSNFMSFDTIALSDTFPVRVNSAYLGVRGNALSPEGSIPGDYGLFPLRVTSFSPSTDFTTLNFLKFDVTFNEGALLPVNHLPSPDVSGIAAIVGRTYEFKNPDAMTGLVFLPAMTAGNGQSLNGQLRKGDFLVQTIDDSKTSLEFTLKNQSLTETLNHIDFDTIFEYEGGIGTAVSETQAIDHVETPSESILGWSDPLVLGGAHYELYKGALDMTGAPLINGKNSLFHVLDNATNYPSSTDLAEDGSYSVPDTFPPIPGNLIDRSDVLQDDLILGPNGESPLQQIEFSPFFIDSDFDVSDVTLRISQKLAYRFDTQPLFTLYEPDDLVSGIQVKTAGARFKGVGVGEDIFSGGSLDVIGPRGLSALAEQMRRNAAEITLNLNPCRATIPLFESDGADDLTLKTLGDCFKTDLKNKTVIAYYEGNENEFLEIGDGTLKIGGALKTVFVPNYKYTIVAKGGLNIYLRNNAAFTDDSSALGIIALSADGRGGNVYIAPDPTNMVGNLYAEGSLLSSPDPAGKSFYYGGTTINSSELSNQLYWQGSVASLNTLGGASSALLPPGVSCSAGVTPFECAQRYDMNFLRRFSAGSNSIANNGKFSGGGSCDEIGVCSHGPLGAERSTLSVEGGLIEPVGPDGSKSLDAFFLEPSARPSPPGFRISGEQESSQVIR